MPDQKSPTKPRRLSRTLAVTFTGFGLLSSLTLAAWMDAWQQRQALAALQNLAATNAAFVSQLRLPRSPELAQRLATILDTGVGFHLAGESTGDWPPGLAQPIAGLVRSDKPASRRAAGYEIATARLGSPEGHLVLMRRAAAWGAGFPGAVLVPSLSLAAACGGLAFALARGLVRPLEQLTAWLPNLDLAPGRTPQPVPEPIVNRPDELGKLAHALEETGQRLRQEQELRRQSERLATLGRVATSLAHEIKNPAAAIALHAGLLREGGPESCPESLELIHEEVDRIIDLVNQWLFVARPGPARTQPRDLRAMLAKVVRRLRPALEHARAAFQLDDGPPAMIEADAPRIEQALRNLLENAAQAMPCGGLIEARIEAAPTHIELRIEDQGPGFSTAALRRFGEPFFSEREGGMGVGLTLAREVIQAHGGSIRAENRAGGGARVVCCFPRLLASGPFSP